MHCAALQEPDDVSYDWRMPIDMKDFARRGAQARLAELVAEMDSILAAFPDLGKGPARPINAPRRRTLSQETRAKMREAWARRKAAARQTPTEQTTDAAPNMKTRVMSVEARAKISAAQKKRWGKRKAGKKR
jgi:hypothetical protein